MDKKKIWVISLDAALLLFSLLAPLIARAMISTLPDCVSLSLGFICPACGGTRCVLNLFRGQFATAFAMNPYIFVTVIFLVLLLILLNTATLLQHRFSQKLLKFTATPATVIIWAIGFATFGILRNVL